MARVTAFRADDEVVLRMLRLRDAGRTAAQIAAARREGRRMTSPGRTPSQPARPPAQGPARRRAQLPAPDGITRPAPAFSFASVAPSGECPPHSRPGGASRAGRVTPNGKGQDMRFLSVCSGIEAASVAWEPLGWEAVAFSELDPFPCAVLEHRYPTVPNWGDMTRFEEWPDADVDVLVGGTPCQDYSVAGLRLGMAGSRGQLTLTFIEIAAKYRPRFVLWENVPGVLSSNGRRDFARFLGDISGQKISVPEGGWQNSGIIPGIADAYGVAYRVLDAQYVRVDGLERAVPQRRRRVFVVGYLGDWRRAAAVLFERPSLCWHPAPRREAGEGVAPTISARTKGGGALGTDFDFDCDGGLIASAGNVSHYLNAGGMGRQDYETETLVVHSLRAGGFDASEDGTGRGTPLVPVAYQTSGNCGAWETGQITGALDTNTDPNSHIIAFEKSPGAAHQAGWRVRRLLPIECERLQGFPDSWTDVPYRGKPAADGNRYKALGNSMAANVMRWIGRRIAMVDAIQADEDAA